MTSSTSSGFRSKVASHLRPALLALLALAVAAAACRREPAKAQGELPTATPAAPPTEPAATAAAPTPAAPTPAATPAATVAAAAAPTPKAAASCGDTMATLAAGSFASKRGGAATITGFCLDLTEVTVAAYQACVDAGKCTEPDPEAGEACNWGASGDPPEVKRGQHPINCVDQRQAAAYCAWRDARLPTAEEFEWAQRGGSAGTPYPWGDDELPRRVCSRANKNPDYHRAPVTCPVGSCPYGDSPERVHDLSGNLAEWTATGPAAGAEQRFVCGGQTSCQAGSVNRVDKTLAAGFCLAQAASQKFEGVGFRCARTP
ncbi:MAG: SUMF1/EgtB/PvdO family nonheme iron enzyme [Myxococcales bacterium]|nr:SUMF1/EgtB/PvdO family nonheme iron enzyme [Myxococcales bacterium]